MDSISYKMENVICQIVLKEKMENVRFVKMDIITIMVNALPTLQLNRCLVLEILISC